MKRLFTKLDAYVSSFILYCYNYGVENGKQIVFLQTNNMEIPQVITDIVKRNGFDYAKYLGVYKGEQVYQPCFDSEEAIYGRPRFIHVKGEKMRWSKNYKEARNTMLFFYD